MQDPARCRYLHLYRQDTIIVFYLALVLFVDLCGYHTRYLQVPISIPATLAARQPISGSDFINSPGTF